MGNAQRIPQPEGHQEEHHLQRELKKAEEEGEVVTSAPTLEKIATESALKEQIRKANGYYDRKAEALEEAHKIEQNKGEPSAKKYLRNFENEENRKVSAELERRTPEGKDTFAGLPPRGEIPAGVFETNSKTTHARVLEALQPLELDVEEVLTKTGKEILDSKLKKKSGVIIESNGKKPRALRLVSENGTVHAFTSPGLKKSNGQYPENSDGFVVNAQPSNGGLEVVMTHAVQPVPEGAALSNTAAVSVAHDLGRLHPPHLEEAMERANDYVLSMKKELDIPKDRLGITSIRIDKTGAGLYDVEVLGASDAHCFVIDPTNGRVQQAAPQTVSAEFSKRRVNMRTTKELLSKYAEKTGAEPEQIKRILTMSSGQAPEFFQPSESHLQVAPGEIVILASADFMRSLGGEEFFQDGTFGKTLLMHLGRGENPEEALRNMFLMPLKRQKDGKLEETALTMIAIQMPEGKKFNQKKPEEHTVQSILGEAKNAPLDIDFDEFETSEKH